MSASYGRYGDTGGAMHLAKIHGTEDDKVNCPFFFKIGACRHGETCQRKHYRPPFSQTILIKKMWYNPMIPVINSGGSVQKMDQDKVQLDFDYFYEELFEELRKFGTIEDIQVLENLADHMIGNVYVKFADEDFAAAAVTSMNGRFYAGRQLVCEFSPVSDFRDSRCRQYDEEYCSRESYCNFMHVREPSRSLRTHLEKQYGYTGGRTRGTGTMAALSGSGGGGGGGRGDRRHGDMRGRDRGRDRDRDSRSRSRSRDRDRRRDRSRSRDRDRRRDRSRSRERR